MASDAIVNTATSSAPKDYELSGTQELMLKAVRASINGASSATSWYPCLQMLAPDGTVMWSAIPSTPVAAGASADVSWFPWRRGIATTQQP